LSASGAEYPLALPKRPPEHPWVVALSVLFVLVMAAGIAAIYFGPEIKEWRHQRRVTQQAEALTAAAGEQLAGGRHDDAERSARQALERRPNHEPAKQIIATAVSQRAILRQREETAAAALAAAERLAAADDLPGAIAALGAICRNPATPRRMIEQAEQRRASLRAATGTLSLPKDWPDDAILRIDGEVQTPGVLTLGGIPLGKRTLEVTRQGHRSPPLMTLEFPGIRPVPLPAIAWELVGGTVVITSEPPGASVWHHGKDSGRTTPCTFPDVKIGNIAYQLKLPGHAETTVEGEVATAATLELQASPPSLPRFPTDGKQAGERQEFNLTPTLRVAFRWCPAGSFTMGGTDVESTAAERPARPVRLTQGFWLAETEFTQGQWQSLTGLSLFAQAAGGSRDIGKGPDYPMYFVSWDHLYGNNARTGGVLAKINAFLHQHGGAGWVADLPTEAQWEYACRAGTATAFGAVQPGPAGVDRMAWHRANSDLLAHPAGQKEANPWGFKDLHGNVFEWCRDWYQDDYGKLPAINPTGPPSGWKIVVRGGSCQNELAQCRAAARGQAYQSVSSALIGFRLALHRPDPPPAASPPKPPAKPSPAKPAPANKAPAKKPVPKPNKRKK
jgi:formylglycine-generating enzyme required for sulfatase activity